MPTPTENRWSRPAPGMPEAVRPLTPPARTPTAKPKKAAKPAKRPAKKRAKKASKKAGSRKAAKRSKSLFLKSGPLVADGCTGELKHAEVRIRQFLPSNQQTSETIHPGVSAFHDPAARLSPMLHFELAFLETASNVRGDLALLEHGPNGDRIVGGVEA